MSQSIALPRIRTKAKRKRRKPMPPHLRWLLFWFCWCCFWFGYDIVDFLLTPEAWDLILAGIMAALLISDWPRFKREWDAWWRSNEDD